jgi:hypothetical protein
LSFRGRVISRPKQRKGPTAFQITLAQTMASRQV